MEIQDEYVPALIAVKLYQCLGGTDPLDEWEQALDTIDDEDRFYRSVRHKAASMLHVPLAWVKILEP